MDILADIACYDTVEENRESIDLVLAGFIDAIDEWLVYHNTACQSFEELRRQHYWVTSTALLKLF